MTLTPSEIDEFAAFIAELGDAAAKSSLPHFRSGLAVDHKEGIHKFDPVTLADREAETAIRQLIAKRYPSHGIHGEEHGQQTGSSRLNWVIDPIDGTRSFIAGVPLWGTLIALNDGTAPVIGLMDQPYLGERYIGRPGGSMLVSKHGTHPLQTSSVKTLEDAKLGTTDPTLFTRKEEIAAFDEVRGRTRLTRYGGDCYFYCLIAAGTLDLVIESGLQPYDIQALIPIIEHAGGVVSNWSGCDAQHGGQIIAAANRTLHEAAIKLLAPAALS